MTTTIFCEAALYGADDQELDHPNYKRQPVLVSVQFGFYAWVKWQGLEGATVSFFRLLLADKVILESDHVPMVIGPGNIVEIYLGIAGRYDAESDKMIDLNLKTRTFGRRDN